MAITDTLWGSIKKPGAARMLRELLDGSEEITGRLIFGWPVGPNLPGQKGAFICDAVLVSDQGQVTVIDLAEDAVPGLPDNYRGRQDHAYNIVRGLLTGRTGLVKGRTPKVLPQTVTFAPEAVQIDPGHPETPLVDRSGLVGKVLEFQARPPEDVDPQEVVNAVIETW